MDAYAEQETERLGFRGTLEKVRRDASAGRGSAVCGVCSAASADSRATAPRRPPPQRSRARSRPRSLAHSRASLARLAPARPQGVYTVDGHWVPILPSDLTVMDFTLETPQTIRASGAARNAKQLLSMAVLLLMGVLCIVTTLAIFAFRAYISTLAIGPYLAGTLNAVAITFLNSLFRTLALGLNEWENHRRASSFTQALVYKMFIFQFINCYFSLFYIAFVKPYRTRGT